jgi:hypothetical protein
MAIQRHSYNYHMPQLPQEHTRQKPIKRGLNMSNNSIEKVSIDINLLTHSIESIKSNIDTLLDSLYFEQFKNRVANNTIKIEINKTITKRLLIIINDNKAFFVAPNGKSEYYGQKGDVVRWENVKDSVLFTDLSRIMQKAIYRCYTQ